MSSATVYTAITFAPVQGFIEKSRKLRDLYGSSFILSYLARALCQSAQANHNKIISPAIINVTQGTPNQIIIKGNFPKAEAEKVFNHAWNTLVECCRATIETKLPNETYIWKRAWKLCAQHTWEIFWAQTDPSDSHKPDRIGDVRRRLNETKRPRDWTGINWSGESSTLSGADAIAWPQMTKQFESIRYEENQQKEFFQKLSEVLSESIIDPDERLSIPELIKRLITLDEIAQKLNLTPEERHRVKVEIPTAFKDINRHQKDPNKKRWTAWFQGDGDRIGEFLRDLVDSGVNEDEALSIFSKAMMNWGKSFRTHLPDAEGTSGYSFIDDDGKRYLKDGRIIYAGGDDFLGVLYRNDPDPVLQPQECLNWFYDFDKIWDTYRQNPQLEPQERKILEHQKITVSVGLVWAAPNIPQRDVLQHCREAEKSAKSSGRDRIAIRILFNGGNHLEWTCPWWALSVLQHYSDRNHHTNEDANWNHILQDVATLEARHAFQDNTDIAIALYELYFNTAICPNLRNNQLLWNRPGQSGILGNEDRFTTEKAKQNALNSWIINLVKVGFQLHPKTQNLVLTTPPTDAIQAA